MTRSFTYRSPTTPAGPGWTEDIPIRLGSIAGITQEAELAAVGVSQITIDDQGLFLSGDPGEGFADLTWSAGVGHAGDAIVGLKQFDWTDSAAPSGHRRIWTGYIQDRTYRRGSEGESPSLITGVDRVIDATLSDINSFLTFRVLGADETSAFDRPEETDVERITALLAVDFLSTTLFDGLVSTSNPVDMDAVNYADQTPAEVINDCVQQSGKNAFVIYDEAGDYGTAGDFVLFYDSNDSTAYPAAADFAVSNVLEDIDFDADRVMTGPVWGPTHDATLVRDPSRVFAGIKLRYDGGSVYVSNLDTSYAFGYRDIVMDAPNVKTEAKALARANRYLADLNSEDDRLSLTLTLPNANVNDWMAGQWAPNRFVHLPGYENPRNLRALSRTVSQDRLTPLFYQVHYECTPMMTPPPATCTTALSGRVIGANTGTSGAGINATIAVSVSATPTSSDPSIIMGFIYNIAGDTPEAHALADPSGFTFIDGYKGTTGNGSDPDWGHRAFLATGVYYKAIASGSTQTMATTYDKGYGGDRWEAVLAIFQTAATSPVQDASATVLANAVAPTLGTPPTPGNMILAFVDARSANDITTAEAGWTQIYASEITQPGGDVTRVRNVAVFMRCFVDGDGHGASPNGTIWQFGAGGGTVDMYAVLTEWAIT